MPRISSATATRKDGGGLTALVFAAREGDFESVQSLVEAGADVNQVTNYGWTAAPYRDPKPALLMASTCSTMARIRISPTKAAGALSISLPTTATSNPAIIPSATRHGSPRIHQAADRQGPT